MAPTENKDHPGKSGDAPGRDVSATAHARNDARQADRDTPGVTDTAAASEQTGVDVVTNTPADVTPVADTTTDPA